jgi:hypothetical protein
MVLGTNALIAFIMFVSTLGLVWLIVSIEGKHAAAQPAE